MKRMIQNKAGINLKSAVLDSILEKVAVGGVNTDYRQITKSSSRRYDKERVVTACEPQRRKGRKQPM